MILMIGKDDVCFGGKTFNLKFLKKYHVIITTYFSLSKGKNKLRNTDLS